MILATPKDGEGSTLQMFALDSGPPNGVAGEAEDVGDAKFEKEGVGVLGRESCQTSIGVAGCREGFVGEGEPLDAKPGTGCVRLVVKGGVRLGGSYPKGLSRHKNGELPVQIIAHLPPHD